MMYVGTYLGPAHIGEVDGMTFPRDVPVEIDHKMYQRLKPLREYDVERTNAEDAEDAGVVTPDEAEHMAAETEPVTRVDAAPDNDDKEK